MPRIVEGESKLGLKKTNKERRRAWASIDDALDEACAGIDHKKIENKKTHSEANLQGQNNIDFDKSHLNERDLKEFGLKKSEIAVYCYLLEHNHATPTQIAKGTGILRTNCYHVLSGLVESGLIREEVGGTGRKMYFANDPESLLRATQKRAAAIERVIPDIRAMFSEKTNKPSVRFYDGKKEIQEIYRASLDAGEVFAVGSTARLQEVMPEFLPWYFAQLKKRRVALYDIVSASSRLITRDVARVALTDYAPKFLPERYKDLPTDILVWDDNVALITLEEPYFGTVLHNAPLAQTMRMILGLLGERL